MQTHSTPDGPRPRSGRSGAIPFPPKPSDRARGLGLLALLSLLLPLLRATPAASQTDSPPVTVQPGAPGEPSRMLDSDEMEALDRPTHTEADVRFLQGMIRHHAQALEMVDLLRDRTESEDLLRLALRIEISQEDEIDLMQRWLRDRDEPVPEAGDAADGGRTAGKITGHGAPDDPREDDEDPSAPSVPGMLTPEQMDALASARGADFDRLFLELMIQHHEGALRMVEDLFRSSGGGQVSSVYHMAGEVQADQVMEIRRMRGMLSDRSGDD